MWILFFVVLAFLSHYLSYLVRGYRWKKMIRPTGFSGGTIDLAKIIFLFQSVDCVLPAKLGDVYGAHLMKINFSLRRSFSLGSIFLWRIMDLVVAMAHHCRFSHCPLRKQDSAGDRLGHEGGRFPASHGPSGGGRLFLRSHRWLLARFESERIKGLIDSFQKGFGSAEGSSPFF